MVGKLAPTRVLAYASELRRRAVSARTRPSVCTVRGRAESGLLTAPRPIGPCLRLIGWNQHRSEQAGTHRSSEGMAPGQTDRFQLLSFFRSVRSSADRSERSHRSVHSQPVAHLVLAYSAALLPRSAASACCCVVWRQKIARVGQAQSAQPHRATTTGGLAV
jgi:hypothetical protein